MGHRYSTARVSKRLTDGSAACLRARYCTNLAWFDLGASRVDIVLLILWEMAALLLVGLGIGTVVSLAAAQGAGALLFGLAPHDGPTLLASAGLLAAVAGFASFVPALRASRVDPMVALRHD